MTIKDNFLFGAVMSVEENCKGFLEMVLGFSIAQVVVSKENKNVKLDDGSCTIFLSTKGENEEKVLQELVRFLKFVTADLGESEMDFQDELVKQFQETIHSIKTDREMGERYMIFEEMLREEKQEGRLEGRQEGRIEGE